MEEVWKPVVGFEGLYEVSNLGNVASLFDNYQRRRAIPLMLRQSTDAGGYLYVNVYKNKIAKKIKVHRLVAQAFIPNPENKKCVNHFNAIRTDNRVENLEWVTHKENVHHTWYVMKRGNPPKGKTFECNFKKVAKYSLDGVLLDVYQSVKEAAEKNNLYATSISFVTDKNRRCGKFRWKSI